MSVTPTIRRATPADLPVIAHFAAQLVRFHHALDARRFFCEEPVEPGYEGWLRHELQEPRAVLLVAERAGQGGEPKVIVGYVYGRMEERDWNSLLDACGCLHDVYVAEEGRGTGVGAALVEAMATHLKEMGAPRLVLSTATQNLPAQRLFERLGFRRTMVEMTRELG